MPFNFGTGVAAPRRDGTTCENCLGGSHRFGCTLSTSTCACSICRQPPRATPGPTKPRKPRSGARRRPASPPRPRTRPTAPAPLLAEDVAFVERHLGLGYTMSDIAKVMGVSRERVQAVRNSTKLR